MNVNFPQAVSATSQQDPGPQRTETPRGSVQPAVQYVPSQASQFSVSYHVDEKSHEVYFQIVDSQSGQVIRQVPPAEVLALEGRIAEFLETEENTSKARNGKGGGH